MGNFLRKNQVFRVLGLAIMVFGIIATIVFSHVSATQDMSTVEPASNQVFFYEHANYGGNTMSFMPDKDVSDLRSWKIMATNNNWNDRISSIKVGSGVKVTAWKDINYKNSSVPYTTGSDGQGHYPSLGSWNDQISSFKVRIR